MRSMTGVYRAALRASRTYYHVRQECPGLLRSIILDLLKFEHLNELEIAFASGVSVETIRDIIHSKRGAKVSERDFLAILNFFSRLFYHQRHN